MLRVITLLVMAIGLAAAPACSKKEGGSKSSKKDEKTDKKTSTQTTGSTTDSDPCSATAGSSGGSTKTATKTESSGETDDGEEMELGLNLLAETTYQDVKGTLNQKCGSCHFTGGTAPGNATTYDGIKAMASKSVTKLASGAMPPSGSAQLTSEEKTKLAAWLQAGAPEGGTSGTTTTTTTGGTTTGGADDDSETSSDDGTGSGTGGGGSPCGTTSGGETTGDTDGTTPPDSAFFDSFVNPEKLKECHSQGKVYERDAMECGTAAWPAKHTCDRTGVLAAFGGSSQAATILDGIDSHKYTYDQCGVDNGKPYILFACFVPLDTPCDPMPTCPALDSLDTDSAHVCVKRMHL